MRTQALPTRIANSAERGNQTAAADFMWSQVCRRSRRITQSGGMSEWHEMSLGWVLPSEFLSEHRRILDGGRGRKDWRRAAEDRISRKRSDKGGGGNGQGSRNVAKEWIEEGAVEFSLEEVTEDDRRVAPTERE